MENIARLLKPAADSERATSDKTPSRPRRDKRKASEVSEDNSEQDEVEEVVGSNENEDRGDICVYHHQIFDRLVAAASDNGAHHYVNEAPAHGEDPSDVTAYRASQMTCAKALAHRPAVLSLWQAPSSFKNRTDDIGKMRFNGKMVLDYTGNPIRTFDIPWAMSSAVEGYRVEAWMRADRRIKTADIVARLYTKLEGTTRVPLFTERGLATRMKRFREEAGLVSWRVQHAKPEAIDFFKSLRSPAQIDHNLAVQRELTMAERSNYTWITIEKNVDVNHANAALLMRRMTFMRRHHRNAIVNYPKGEFEPGAQKGGDLWKYSFEEPSDESGLAIDDASEDDIEQASVPAPSSRPMRITVQNTTIGASRIIVGQANTSDDGGEVQDQGDYLNEESWQSNQFVNPALASYGRRRLAENYNEVPSVNSIHSELGDPTDSRNDEPASAKEAQMLQSALEQTITDFNELSDGNIPNQTNLADNYFSQWAALQTQFAIVWTGLWSNDNAPTLRGLGRWTGGISNWQTAGLARTDRVIADEEAWAMYSEEG